MCWKLSKYARKCALKTATRGTKNVEYAHSLCGVSHMQTTAKSRRTRPKCIKRDSNSQEVHTARTTAEPCLDLCVRRWYASERERERQSERKKNISSAIYGHQNCIVFFWDHHGIVVCSSQHTERSFPMKDVSWIPTPCCIPLELSWEANRRQIYALFIHFCTKRAFSCYYALISNTCMCNMK